MSASSIETSERRICSIPSLLSTSSLTLAVVSATAGTALAGGKADKLVVNHDPEERGFARILRSISQAFQRVGEDEENTYYLGNRAAAPAKASPAPTTPAFAPTTSAPVLSTAAALSAEKRTKAAPEQTAVYASPVIITPASADAGSAIDAVKWHPHVDLIAKPGTDRMIGKADFFAPLMQDEDSMLFANMRGVFTSDPIQEGNFGLGYRQIVPQGFFGQDAIFGVYGFFDVRNSQNNNMFYQGTFGGEILTEMFEFRANAYLPNRKTHQVAGVGGGGVVLNGVTLTQGGGLVERALPGFDLEAGVKIPIFDKTSFRLNAAYFRFERGQTLVEGPRVRGEFIWDDVGGVQGAKISIGGEFRHDKVRGSDGYGFVRLRIPLYDVNGPSAPRRELVGIEREMTRFIHRDADILTPTVEDGAGGAGGQALTDQASGQELNVFEVAQAAQGAGDCTSGNACTVAQAFGGGALGGVTPGIGDIIFTVNDAGNINADINLNAARQQIVGDPTGAGTQVTLPDAAATQFTATNASGRATVAGMITLSQDNTVRGFDVNSPGNGLIGTGNIGTATIADMTIQGANGGATFNGNPMGTANFANDVTINNVGGNPALGVGGGSLNVNFSGNINNTGAGAAFSAQNGHTGTVTFDTGTINATNGTGLQFNDADGNYNFNGTATLNGGDAGIDILGNSAGTFTFGAGTAITNPTGIGLLVLGDGTNNPAITYNGTINNNADRAVTISSTAAGANQININGAITDSGTGIFFNAVAQNVNFAGSNALTGGGIDILGGTGTFTFTDTDITNPADTALEINGGSSNVNVGANSAFSQNGNQTVVDVNNGHSGNLNFMGTINATNGDGLQFDNADGTYDFNGAIALNGGDAGIDILNGSAGTFTFANTAITSPTGDAVNVNGSSANVNFGSSSSITQANNASAVQLTNHTGGTFQFDGTINATNGDGLQFDNADGIYNFTDQVTLNGGDAGIDILNGSDGVFTFTNTDITSPTGTAVDISGTTGNITFGADSSITQANNALAIDIENLISGILQFNGTVNATNGTGIELNNVDGTANFAGTVTLNGGDAGVDIINGSGGGITFTDLDITSPTGVGLRIDASDGNFTFGAGSSITQANNASAVQITGPTTGTTNFNGTINATNGDGLQFDNADGTYNFNGAVTLNGGDAGIDILNDSSGTFTFVNTDITNPTGTGLNIDSSDANVDFQAASSIAKNNAGRTVSISSNFGGTVNIVGPVNATDAATGIVLENNTGGIFTFTDANLGTNANRLTGGGLILANNSGGTFNFTALDIFTNGVEGIFANNNTGTSAFNVTNGNVDTTGESAIDITGTIIGGTNLNFTNIMADGGTNDGIILNNVSGGSFNVTGTATARNIAGNGINISNSASASTFASVDIDDLTGSGIGIMLSTNTGLATFNGGNIDDVSGDGVDIMNAPASFNGLQIGSAASSTIGGHGVDVQNTDATSRTFSFINGNIGLGPGATITDRGISIQSTGTGTLTATVTTNQIASSNQAIFADGGSNAGALVIDLSNNGTLQTTNGSTFTMQIQGSAAGATTVTALGGGTTTIIGQGAANGGGILFDTVTFDADVGTGGIQQVTAGTFQIGQGTGAAQRVAGDGLSFLRAEGDLAIGTLNIFNVNGTGLEVDTKTGGPTTFTLGTSGGTIDTDGGPAMFLDPLTINMTLGSVTSNNAAALGATSAQASGDGNGITLDNVAGTLNITGTTTINNAAGDGIELNNNTGTFTFGTVNIDLGASDGSRGIDYTGSNAAHTFGTVTITDIGAGTNQVGIDFNGATLTGTQAYNSVIMSGPNTSTTSVGVDLTGILGNQIVNLGSQVDPASGPSSSITDLHRGVVIDTTGQVQFTFGDGESPNDTGSSIDVNGLAGSFTVDTGMANPLAASSYDFEDVAFGAGDQANFAAAGTAPVFVSETGGVIAAGTFGLSADLTTVDVATAEGQANTGQTFVFVAHDGTGIIDVTGGGADGFTLLDGQTLDGFDDSNSFTFGTIQPGNVLGNFGALGGTVTQNNAGQGVAAQNSNGGATSVVSATAGNNTIRNTVFDGTGGPGALISVTGINTTPVTIDNVELTNIQAGDSGLFFNNNMQNVTVTDTDLFGTNTGTAVNIDPTTASTGIYSFDAASDIDGTTGSVVSIGAGTRNITFANAIGAANNTEKVIDIDGQSGGAIAFNGAITSDLAIGDNVIEVTGQSGGTLTFGTVGITNYGNATTDVAIEIAGTGGSATFGDTDITTVSGGGFSATGPNYTVATAAGSTISTDGATALNLNTVIAGTGGINFDTVAATNLGTPVGINVVNTTTSGGQGITIGSASLSGGTSQSIALSGITGAGGFDLTSANITNGAGGTGVQISGANTSATIAIGNGLSNGISGLDINGGNFGVLASYTAGTVNLGSTASANSRVRIGNTTPVTLNGVALTSVGGTFNFGNATTQSSVASDAAAITMTALGATGDVNVTNVTVASTNSLAVVESTSASGATIDFDTLQVTGTGGASNAILSTNTDGALTFTALDINSAGADGVAATDNNILGSIAIAGTSTIDGTGGDGVNVSGLDTSITGTLTIAGAAAIGADGIDISDGGVNTNVSVSGVTVTNTGAGSAGIKIDGSGAGTLTINAFAGNTVTDAAANGIDITDATFDATTGGGIDQVLAGATSVGTIGNRVEGDGVRLNNVLGNVNFSDLDVFNNNGTGLFVRDAGGKGGVFAISTTTGTIDTTNGTALDIDPVQGNFTFASISSTNANGQGSSATTAGGIFFDTVDAVGGSGNNALNVTGTTTITNSTDEGINITNSTGLFTFGGQVTIDNTTSGAGGVDIDLGAGGTATVSFNGGLDIDTTAGTGIDANGSAGTLLTLNVTDSGTETIDTTTGTVLNLNDVTIGGSGVHFDTTNATGLNGNIGIDLLDTIGGTLNIGGGTITNGGAGDTVQIGANGDANSGGSATVTIGANLATNGTGNAVTINELNGADVTFSGNLTDSAANTGGNIVVRNTDNGSASSVTFSGATKRIQSTTNVGVFLNTNPDGTINFTGGGLDIDTTTAGGFQFSGGGTLNVTGASNTVTTTTGQILSAVNGSVGASGVTFASLTSGTVAGTTAININNLDGSGNTFNGGAVTIGGTTGGANEGIAIVGGSDATFSFASATIDNTAGAGIALNSSSGPVTFTTVDIDGTGGDGVTILNTTGVVAINGGTIGATNDPAGNAVEVNGGNANVTVAAALTKTTAGNIVNVTGRTGGTVTFSGNLSATGGVDNGILVTSNTGGATTFSGGTKTISTGANIGVSLVTNNGHTINFTGGGLDIDTTGGTGFNATNGGTINVTGTGNTLDTTTGQIFNGNGVSVGASGITFASLTSTGTVPTDAISLVNVDGTGNTFNGGTVGIAGTSGAASDGIEITGGSDATFTFGSVTIDGTGQHGLNLGGASGPLTITSVDIDNTAGDGINMLNFGGVVDIQGGTIGGTNDPTGNGVQIDGGSANVTIAATITKTTAGKIVDVRNRTGGAITFSGAISATGGVDNGIEFAANTGGTTGFTNDVTLTTGGSTSLQIGSSADHAVTFSGTNTDIDATTGTAAVNISGGGTVNFNSTGVNTINTTSATALRASGGGTVVVGGTADVTSAGGRAVELDGVVIGAAGVTVSTTTATGSGTGVSINSITGTGTVNLGTTSLTGITSRGVDISGTSTANLTFTDLDIALNSMTAVAFDMNGAAFNGNLTANDFDVTNAMAAGTSIGIDLQGATGTGIIQLGDTTAGDGNGASIVGVNGGVVFDAATNLTDFNYGDREGTTDTASTINATSSIVGTLPAAGDYDFLDVDVAVGNYGAVSGPAIFVFDDENTAGAGTFADPGSIAEAEASTATVLVAVNDVSGTNDLSFGAGQLDLDDGQFLISLGSGDSYDTSLIGVTGGSLPAGFQFTGLSGGTTITATGGTLSATKPTLTSTGGDTISFTGSVGIGNIVASNSGGAATDVIQGTFAAGTHTVIIRDSEFTDGGDGIVLEENGVSSPTVTYTIENNDFNGIDSEGIIADFDAGAGIYTGTINNNRLGTTMVAGSGSTILVEARSAVTHNVTISNNVIRQHPNGFVGIDMVIASSGILNADVENNTIDEPAGVSAGGLIAITSDSNANSCAHISGNILDTTGNAGLFGAILTNGSGTGTVTFPGLVGGAPGDVATLLDGQNTITGVPTSGSFHTHPQAGTGTECVP